MNQTILPRDILPRGRPGQTRDQGTAPQAIWMDNSQLVGHPRWDWSTGALFLGRAETGEMIGSNDDRHIMTIAGSRAGKGLSAIIPNLLTYQGSMLVLDPKGENATISAARRGNGEGCAAGGLEQDVFVIDPFEVADVPETYRAGFNPLATLDPLSPTFVDDCDGIADALVIASSSKQNDHWNASARLVIRGFVAWVAAAPDVSASSRTLHYVYHLLHLPSGSQEGGFINFLDLMASEPDVGFGLPAQTAHSLAGMEERELASVMSTVRHNIGFLASPPMAAALTGGARQPDINAWKMGGQTVYLCLPATRLHRHARFFRVFLNRLLSAVESVPEKPKIPAVMMLDEMHVLGHMALLETAAGLIAGYGVRIWSIWQDLAQLKSIYSARWETFLGNAGIFQTFGLNDQSSLDYVSKRLGKSSMLSLSSSEQSTQQAALGFSGQSKSIQDTPLLSPDEVAYHFSRQSGAQLILYPGASPIWLERVPHTDAFFDEMKP